MFSFLRLVTGQNEPPPARVPVGTKVEIELLDDLSSESLHNGESVAFKVVSPVVVNGTIHIPAGTPVSGEVKGVQAAHSWHKAGSFALIFHPVQLDDGSVVQLDFAPTKIQGTRGEKTMSAIGTSMVLTYYFPLIPLVLVGAARKGQAYKIKAGERYLVYVVSTGPSAGRSATQTALPTAEPPK
jgi:hypothetical protein